MANCANSTTAPTASRRTFGAGLLAVMAGSVITSGVAGGTAASVGDLVSVEVEPDAALLSMRAEMTAAVAGIAYDENAPEWSDDELTRSAERLSAACWAIVDAPCAQTPAGWALKAAASMYQLREGYSHGGWNGDGEDMAWQVLSALAGSVYVPPIMPARLVANNEPARA